MKVIIVGGVAAGASAAARLRRLNERAEIILVEAGAYISYANCGLPYSLGGVIAARENLMVMEPAKFKAWFNVDVRTCTEAVAIDRERQTITLRSHGQETVETYDFLLLATGSTPVSFPLPGIDDRRIHSFWTVPDMDAVSALAAHATQAVVVGGGFIGTEVAENLAARGIKVTVVEFATHLLANLDAEMARWAEHALMACGIALQMGRKVEAFEAGETLKVVLDDGSRLPADFVVMCAGVRPNSALAQAAGLTLGARGHICVGRDLRTSDPHIFAAGDVVEVVEPIFGGSIAIPLAGPANKQGRLAADAMMGLPANYAGTYGASIVKVGELAIGSVGMTEARLVQMKVAYQKLYLHTAAAAMYYPGGTMLHIKVLFTSEGQLLGAQIAGSKGVDKRIDTLAMAMRAGWPITQLAELECAYAPPFNAARDPVNFIGMVAGNVLSGRSRIVHADAIPSDAVILDVREAAERKAGFIPGSLHLPLGQLRQRLSELDRRQSYVCSCAIGLRGYLAERILRQNGLTASNLSGGYLTWKTFHAQ
ncbi:MAG: FAD-dependent oxidoreductase [Kiritimatiellia bacterium]